MNIEVQRGKNKIAFSLSAELFNYVSKWEYAVDKSVFEEQLSTGMFRGNGLDEDVLTIMRKAKEAGRVMPYYGAGGSRGACRYSFIPKENQCQLQVKHSATETVLEIFASLEVVKKGLFKGHISRFKFSPLPYFIAPEDLPDAWQIEPDTQRYCPIMDDEYENLKKWEYWEETQALTGRYKYNFGAVSLGTGFTIEVQDAVTGNLIDVTHYDDW